MRRWGVIEVARVVEACVADEGGIVAIGLRAR